MQGDYRVYRSTGPSTLGFVCGAVVMVCCTCLVGTMDYRDSRRAECSRHHQSYNAQTDLCEKASNHGTTEKN